MTDGTITYSFSEEEIKSLTLLLRRNEAVLDTVLDEFHGFLENTVYQNLTIAEAEDFYNEKR